MNNVNDAPLTADSKEITFFNNKRTWWWSEKTPLHDYNKLRVPLVRDGLIETGLVDIQKMDESRPLKGLQILDVGCGGGILAEALAELGCDVIGVDLGTDTIQRAKDHASLNPSLTNLNYICESIEDHAKHNQEKYDAVVASEVVEHVNNPELFLESCVKCLKPGGSVFITTFNKTWASWLLGIIFAEYVWGFISPGTHSWDKFVPPEEVEAIFKKFNCETRCVRGVTYNFLSKTWHYWWTKSIAYVMHAVKDK